MEERHIDYRQKLLIKNYNFLVNRLQKSGDLRFAQFQTLNEDGACHGLAVQYLFYAKQERYEEFFELKGWFTQCTETNLNKLADYCIKDTRKFLTGKQRKLLDFVKGIDEAARAQRNESHLKFIKSIGAHWDDGYSFNGNKQQLVDLIKNNPKFLDFEFALVSTLNHSCACYIKNSIYLYDPSDNNPPLPISIKKPEEIAQSLFNIVKRISIAGELKNIAISFNKLSYYAFKENELDQIMSKYRDIEVIAPEVMAPLVELYAQCQQGEISRLDFVWLLNKNFLSNIDPNSKFVVPLNALQQDLQAYYDKHVVSTYLINTLQQNINVTANNDGTTWLMLAAEGNQISLVDEILRTGCDNINAKNVAGYTALYYAAYNAHIEIFKLLIAANADLTIPNKAGKTPLECILENGHPDYLKFKFLIDEGKLQLSKEEGEMLLPIVARNGDINMMELLINMTKADVNSPNKKGITSLQMAAYHGNVAMVEFLITKGADINVNAAALFSAIMQTIDHNNENTNAVTTLLISHLIKTNDTDKTIELIQHFKQSLIKYIEDSQKKFFKNIYDTYTGNKLSSEKQKLVKDCIHIINWLEKSDQLQTTIVIKLIDRLKQKNQNLSKDSNHSDLGDIVDSFQEKFAQEMQVSSGARRI
jgi:ankyrin repeat protein